MRPQPALLRAAHQVLLVLALVFATPALARATPATQPAAIVSMAAGGFHTCTLLSTGAVRCWGNGASGQLGFGSVIPRIPSANLAAISGVSTIAAGLFHTCATTMAGLVYCWGENSDGQLGLGDTIDRASPIPVPGITDAVAVAAGFLHTCALLSSGGVKCWGVDTEGELGTGSGLGANPSSPTPVDVLGLGDTATALASGSFHTCVLLSGGGVKCWGKNDRGQLGDGTTVSGGLPVSVAGMTGVRQIVTNINSSCVLTIEAGVRCWGSNYNGELGNGGPRTSSPTPVDVTGLSGNVASISTSAFFICALLTTGGVRCWGDDGSGQLGDGGAIESNTFSNVPVDVLGVTNATHIATGYYHACAALDTGEVRCWGDNAYYQLGTTGVTKSSTPL
ncbi:chromosome condensation regulator RCC1 [Chloroflexia bacterium SDU3-3]|nr:chromosome condensation regulator RCC1 [Chloroflexia bacterium SDU3-3]